MADDNATENQETTNESTETQTENIESKEESRILADQDLIEKLVQERLDNQLQPIKKNLDKAYALRDEALKKAEHLEAEKKEAELKRLEEEGNFKEAYERRLKEMSTKNETLAEQNIRLTRDIDVRQALNVLDFRNDRSYEMARKEITEQLVKNENGTWVHRSGITIQDFVKSFAEDDGNSFLFKAKVSSGSGGSGPSVSNKVSSNEKKSLFEMSQEEVIKMAEEGRLPRQHEN